MRRPRGLSAALTLMPATSNRERPSWMTPVCTSMNAVNAVVLELSDVWTLLPATIDPVASCDDGSCATDGDVGCIDDEACNFTPNAICSDGSCQYLDECGECGGTGTLGCTNPLANNYDASAGCDDGSCIVYGCTVNLACNFEPTANIDDNSCEFGTCPGCNDPEAFNYNPTSSNDEICGGTCGDPLYFNGKFYQTGLFDSGCWMVEDLQFSPQQWISSANEVSCDIPKTYLTADSTVVYNWPAANQSCPVGWRLPNGLDESEGFLEFQDLSEYLETGGCSGSGYLETISEGINIYWLSEGSWGASNLNEWIFLGSINASYGFSVRCIKE